MSKNSGNTGVTPRGLESLIVEFQGVFGQIHTKPGDLQRQFRRRFLMIERDAIQLVARFRVSRHVTGLACSDHPFENVRIGIDNRYNQIRDPLRFLAEKGRARVKLPVLLPVESELRNRHRKPSSDGCRRSDSAAGAWNCLPSAKLRQKFVDTKAQERLLSGPKNPGRPFRIGPTGSGI